MQALGECTIYDRTAPAEVLERAAGAEILLTNKTVLTAEHMAALPELKYIGVLATGYNIVDTTAAKERGIIVTNIPAYSTDSVAQMVFAHILNITQQVQHLSLIHIYQPAGQLQYWKNNGETPGQWDEKNTLVHDITTTELGVTLRSLRKKFVC